MLFKESTITILSLDKDLSTSDLSTPLKFFSAGISNKMQQKYSSAKDKINIIRIQRNLQ